jgi:hypothetical protein
MGMPQGEISVEKALHKFPKSFPQEWATDSCRRLVAKMIFYHIKSLKVVNQYVNLAKSTDIKTWLETFFFDIRRSSIHPSIWEE